MASDPQPLTDNPHPPTFGPATWSALLVPGVAERWAAVQAQVHPVLAAVAAAVDALASAQLGRAWSLYEVSWKTARVVNRGRAGREPINEYHFAIDRMPRGAGLYVGISTEDQAVLVGFTLAGRRKNELARVWEAGRNLWQPLVGALPEVRYGGAAPHSPQWLDHYLAHSQAQYVWAGYRYDWHDPRVTTPEFVQTLAHDAVRLLPLLEAVMEEAERQRWHGGLHEPPTAYNAAAAMPPIEAIIARIAGSGFVYNDALVRGYHVALQTKPLVILPGISGTGKTRLTRLYADAVHAIAPDAANPFYLLVAVQPDWHNSKDLLGYYNSLTGVFHPSAFLRFLHRAAADPQQPHYVCLDEMNLARPEYYLAPLLSALETAEHTLDLNTPGPTVTTADGETLPNPFRLPLNVAITGTVNVDESTFGLSDKLLDRANVIELTEVDVAAFRRIYRGPINEAAWQVITQLHAVMSAAGQPFGYRTITEMLRFVANAATVLPPDQALDLQIKQKVLPKLRGDDSPRFRQALEQLLALLTPRFPESAAKVTRMQTRLHSEGFTDFYGA